KYGFDLSGLGVFAADGTQITNGAVGRHDSLLDPRWCNAAALVRQEALAKRGGQARHRGEIKLSLRIERLIQLRTAVRAVAERHDELCQFLCGFSEKFDRHEASPRSLRHFSTSPRRPLETGALCASASSKCPKCNYVREIRYSTYSPNEQRCSTHT